MNKIDRGKEGESIAIEYLQKSGHTIIDTNFRNRLGEIDIISLRGETLYFSEVKNWTGVFYSPLETFTEKKISKMRKLTEFFLSKHTKYSKNYLVSFCLIKIERENVEFFTDLF
ncbi:MAG: YraN family protein [Leptospiraceae bacterium]|nr:YraN family protein [Leptospiraceae bacterium]MCP5495418.1 YraN family protein [Leptospiraceae bacterium]